MTANFVIDVHLEGSDEILQVPLLQSVCLKKQWRRASKKMKTTVKQDFNVCLDALEFEQYRNTVGVLFGKDVNKWKPLGTDQVDVVEEDGMRTTKRTGVYSGVELLWFYAQPFYDERLSSTSPIPALCFGTKKLAIEERTAWLNLVAHTPYTPSQRRSTVIELVKEKQATGDAQLQLEAMHELYELCINRKNHQELDSASLSCIVQCLNCGNEEVKKISAAVIWSLAVGSENRKSLVTMSVIDVLMTVLSNSATSVADDRGTLKEVVLGALSVLLVDRSCRVEFLKDKNNLIHLLSICQSPQSTPREKRHVESRMAAKLVISIVQRDHDIRMQLVESQGMKIILDLLKEDKAERGLLHFFMTMVLSTLVLDDVVMETIRQKNECYTLFQCCLSVLDQALGSVESAKLESQQDVLESIEKDGKLLVRLAEGCAQALWGAAYYCALQDGNTVSPEEIDQLATLAMQSAQTTKVLLYLVIFRYHEGLCYKVSLNHVTHCLTASLATFCSNPSCAAKMVPHQESKTIQTLLLLLKLRDSISVDGHVIAAACTGLAFLACHPIGAKGEDCMAGPYRTVLLANGAFGALLSSLVNPPFEEDCRAIVEESAAIGVMFLSTMAGKLEEECLESLSILLKSSGNIQMLEYLMAGMWILLRNPENRNIIARAFEAKHGQIDSKTERRIAEAIEMHEITEEKLQRHSSCESKINSPVPTVDDVRQEDTNAATSEDEWGLESLVNVGERWFTALNTSKTKTDSHAAILKLFEFLTASLCLFLIPDDKVPELGPQQVFEYDSTRNCWWTTNCVGGNNDSSEEEIPDILRRAVVLLSSLLELNYHPAWKVMQLACVTLWNLSSRSIPVHSFLAKSGICTAIMDVAASCRWPTSLRHCAAGFLQSFREMCRYHTYMKKTTFYRVMIELLNTEVPLLELVSAKSIGRCVYYVPTDCSNPKGYLVDCKECLADNKAIESLTCLLRRLNKRLIKFLETSPPEDLRLETAEDDCGQYERNMNNVEAVVETYQAVFVALVNLSVLASNQDLIGKSGLETLLETNTLLFERRESLFGYGEQLVQLCSSVLHNVSLHPKNRTRCKLQASFRDDCGASRLYKAELSGSVAARSHQANGKTMSRRTRKTHQRPKVHFPPRAPQLNVKSSPSEQREEKCEPNVSCEFIDWMNNTTELTPKKRDSTWLRLMQSRKEETPKILDSCSVQGSDLYRTLCRPLNHSWEVPVLLREGHWNPAISEYREAKQDLEVSVSVKKLLTTGQPSPITSCDKIVSLERPSTTTRNSGRIPIMIIERQSAGDKDAEVGVNVVISPQRPRTIITFAQHSHHFSATTKQPQLTMFEHVIGSKVSDGLFPSYSLPSGKSVFYHYTDGLVINEVAVERLPPPERPNSIPAALQEGMPLTKVLDIIAKPPGSGAAVTPYQPMPRLVPHPKKHTLPVKYPEGLDFETFGDLREDNLCLVLKANQIQQTRTTTKTEKIEKEENKEPWSLPVSIFKPRIRDSDAKDFYDTPKVLNNSFEKDWQRCCQKEKFSSMISREAKAINTAPGGVDEKKTFKKLQIVIKENYWWLCSAFMYYAATGSGDPFHLSLNSFTSFLDECSIVDAVTKRSDCDTIFIVANFVADKKAPENAVNNEQALMRFEFMEAIVRIGILKYGKNGETEDVAKAVACLFENNIKQRMGPEMSVAPNEFRKERLYVEEVDVLLKKHSNLLKAIYGQYRTKPPSGGLRYKVVKLDGWLQLMEDASLIDAEFTLLDAILCFLRSRMWTQDEVKDYAKYESLTFVDFLEALARSADTKQLPTQAQLEEGGYNDISEWAVDKTIETNDEGLDEDEEEYLPLHSRLDMFLELIFRTLYYEASQSRADFSHETLLKIIKKKDKDLGP